MLLSFKNHSTVLLLVCIVESHATHSTRHGPYLPLANTTHAQAARLPFAAVLSRAYCAIRAQQRQQKWQRGVLAWDA